MDRDAREVAFAEKPIELGGTAGALNENDDLIELEIVEEIIKLSILFTFVELDIVLLQPVEGELGLIIDVNLQGILHELLADGSDLLRESGGEHHNLLLGRGGSEDILNVAAHV